MRARVWKATVAAALGIAAIAVSPYPSAADVPATLSLTPPIAENLIGTSHTVEAMVRDGNGFVVEGVIVRFSVVSDGDGAVRAMGACTTGPTGCSFTYQGPAHPDTDTVPRFRRHER